MTDTIDARELLDKRKAGKLFALDGLDPMIHFRPDRGGVEQAYQEIARRVGA